MLDVDAVRGRIRARIEALGLSMTGKWFKDAGMGQTTVRNFLDGMTQSLTLDTVAKLEAPLKVSAQWLLFGDEAPTAISSEQVEQMVGEALVEMQPGMTLAEIRPLVASSLRAQLGRALAGQLAPDQMGASNALGTVAQSRAANKAPARVG